MTLRLPLLACLAVFVISGCTDCKAIDVRDGAIELIDSLPSKRILIEVKAGNLQASIEAKPTEKEYRGKGCGKLGW